MITTQWLKFLFLTLLIGNLNCKSQISEISGKCDKEKKEKKRCLITTILASELLRLSKSDKNQINSTSNEIDNQFIFLTTSCEISSECIHTSYKINSNNE